MNNYFDKYGRIHDKPCINGEPSSNNGWIYTAYYFKLNNIYPNHQYTPELIECFSNCKVYYETAHKYILNRHPDKSSVPFSRDEYLGCVSLGLLNDKLNNSWNFSPFIIPKFSIVKLEKQLWELFPSLNEEENIWSLKYKHRNYFWQNNLDQLYRFAFSVPLTDRYIILKCWGKFKWYKPSHLFYLVISKLDSLLPIENGVRYLKYGKSLKAMQKEFPNDHLLTRGI